MARETSTTGVEQFFDENELIVSKTTYFCASQDIAKLNASANLTQ